MKKLINIRGGVASGKTTSVRQYCNVFGFTVEKLRLKNCDFPVTVISSQNAVALGDYGSDRKCTGCDAISRRDGKGIGNAEIASAVIAVAKKYNPDTIIYEHMIGSQLYTSTKRIADAGTMLGYEYRGVQLWRSDSSRMALLEKRSGAKARTKNFIVNAMRVNRATEMLNENGYRVKVVNADKIPFENMWKVVGDEINKS